MTNKTLFEDLMYVVSQYPRLSELLPPTQLSYGTVIFNLLRHRGLHVTSSFMAASCLPHHVQFFICLAQCLRNSKQTELSHPNVFIVIPQKSQLGVQSWSLHSYLPCPATPSFLYPAYFPFSFCLLNDFLLPLYSDCQGERNFSLPFEVLLAGLRIKLT